MPEDDSPGLASVIANAMESRLVDVHTALPARVESYDAGRQVADVKPMIRRVIRAENMDRVSEELPVIPCVPVLWPRGGGAFISLPLAAGDFGWVMFGDYSIDRFRSTGQDSDPGDERRFDLANAVFLPHGPFPSSEKLADADASQIRIGFDGGYQAEIRDGEARFPKDATKKLARDDRVEGGLQNIVDAITDAVVGSSDGGALFQTNMIALLTSPVAGVGSDTVKGT